MKTLNLLILVLSFILLTGTSSYSQSDSARSRDKLKKIIKEKIIEKLKIDESSATKLIDLTTENRKDMKDLKKKRKELTEYIFENAQTSDVGTKMEDLMDTENKINQSRNDFYTKLKTFLTPNQIAQAMVFQKDLMKFMKKEMKRNKKDDNMKGDSKNKDEKRKDSKRNKDSEVLF